MKIGLIVAMDVEFNLVKQILTNTTLHNIKHLNFVEGTFNNHQIILMKSGIGKVCAAVATTEMIDKFSPDYIINTGIAGGIDKTLSVMDVVIGEKTAYHDVWCGEGNEYGQVQGLPTYFNGNDKLLNKATKIKSDIRIHMGLIVSGDKFITSVNELKGIKEKFPQALAVDMESAAIAQVCHLLATPYMAVRIISDTPGIENHYAQYKNFWQQAPEKSLEIIKQLIA